MASASSDTIVIQEAAVSDAAVLAEIGSSSFRDAYAAHSNPADLEQHLEKYFTQQSISKEIEAGASTYLIAFVDDAPGGIAKFRKANCPVPGGDDNAIELQQLYVLSATQGHGLGRQLLERVTEVGTQYGSAGVWLSAWESADWATGFYARVGFAEIGKVPFKLGEMLHTDLLMWRPIT